MERGNKVCFGPGEGGSYIVNQESGDKLMLKENEKGSYIMEVDFVGGGRRKSQLIVGPRKTCARGIGGANFG